MRLLVVQSTWDEPQLKLIRTSSKEDADLTVRIVNSPYDLLGVDPAMKPYKWLFVSSKFDNFDKSVLFVDSELDADLKVFIAPSDYDEVGPKKGNEEKVQKLLAKAAAPEEAKAK